MVYHFNIETTITLHQSELLTHPCVGRVEASLSIEEVEKLFPTVCVYAILSVSVFTQGERVWRHLAPLSREEKSSLLLLAPNSKGLADVPGSHLTSCHTVY